MINEILFLIAMAVSEPSVFGWVEHYSNLVGMFLE
jgi:hypothetical protein